MNSVTINHTISALPSGGYRAWRLTLSATNPSTTDGTFDDPNIFVMRIHRTTNGDRDVFSHVASLWEMRNVPGDKADIPPKAPGFYRCSSIELDFQSRTALDLGLGLINRDVALLLSSTDDSTYVVPLTSEISSRGLPELGADPTINELVGYVADLADSLRERSII